MSVEIPLGELARKLNVRLHGDENCIIDRVDTIQDAQAGALCFLANKKYAKHLATTQASVVIVSEQYIEQCNTNALITDNPYLVYARAATLLYPSHDLGGGVHPSAVVDETANIDPTAYVGPCCVIQAGADIGKSVAIGPGCVVQENVTIGNHSQLRANVTICEGVSIGNRVIIHPGAVIGGDGFGNANDNGSWVKVPQLGSVVIGDDVEVGANTTIDRGALRDTIIEQGARLDNQIMIAHNVKIGAHSALAGCVGIAGSTTVGKYCTLGGGVGLSGHLEIGDNIHFTGQSLVTRSFKEPGIYSGNMPAVTNADWRKSVARIRQLDDLAKRLKSLERQVLTLENKSGCEEE